MMNAFVKVVSLKRNKTEQEKQMVEVMSSSYDISDKKYIEPILKCLKK